MSTMAGEGVPLGPGTLKIGATGTEIDVSCLVNNAVIAAEKEQGDSVTKLCGTVVPGATTYSYVLSGNMDTDIAEATGFFALSVNNPGSQQGFEYVPNTEAGTTASGTLILDPLDFGGDETTQTMTSDFEFTIVGEPAYTFGGAAVMAEESEVDSEPVAV